MELNIHFKKLSDVVKKNTKRSLKIVLEFKTHSYIIFFVFDFWVYIVSFVMGLLVLFLYYFDIKLYSILKNIIVKKCNFYSIENGYIFEYIKVILVLFFLLSLLLIIILMYKRKTKEEFRIWIRTMLYYRINFIVNYYIFIKIFNIAIAEFIEYNIIIIIIFIIYSMVQLWGILYKKEIKFKLLHYLNWPGLSVCFWIFIFLNVKNLLIFESLYNDFVGYDDKYYDIVYINLESDNLIGEIKI